jgi:hypothetical protein
MGDRHYVTSLALSLALAVLALLGIAAIPVWLGWPGVAALWAAVGGFLVWFYWGPRPDLRPDDTSVGRKSRDDD